MCWWRLTVKIPLTNRNRYKTTKSATVNPDDFLEYEEIDSLSDPICIENPCMTTKKLSCIPDDIWTWIQKNE